MALSRFLGPALLAVVVIGCQRESSKPGGDTVRPELPRVTIKVEDMT